MEYWGLYQLHALPLQVVLPFLAELALPLQPVVTFFLQPASPLFLRISILTSLALVVHDLFATLDYAL